jgi:hypothetical protein
MVCSESAQRAFPRWYDLDNAAEISLALQNPDGAAHYTSEHRADGSLRAR